MFSKTVNRREFTRIASSMVAGASVALAGQQASADDHKRVGSTRMCIFGRLTRQLIRFTQRLPSRTCSRRVSLRKNCSRALQAAGSDANCFDSNEFLQIRQPLHAGYDGQASRSFRRCVAIVDHEAGDRSALTEELRRLYRFGVRGLRVYSEAIKKSTKR